MAEGRIHVEVRDGRMGRDQSMVTEAGGELLMEYDTDVPVDVSDRLMLPGGTEVEVIGYRELLGETWTQIASVGNTLD